MKEAGNQEASTGLLEEEKRQLLLLARSAIESKIRGLKDPSLQPTGTLLKKRGVFVTIHKRGALRGCIGFIQGTRPLHEVVAEMARAAAFGDPRFPPVKAEELADLELEISVLTPLRKIRDVSEIEVGTHGIFLVNGAYSGLLLPQVATEYGWDRMTFLRQTCVKAGLSQEAWQDPGSEIFVFSADIFSEKENPLT